MEIERLSSNAVSALHRVWEAALGPTWSLPQDRFAAVLAEKELLAVREAGAVIGFVAQEHRGTLASIAVHAVRPERQNRGVGRALLREALARLDQTGVTTVRAGAGCGAYFWPGIPSEQSAARRLFETAGFAQQEPRHDLCLPLAAFGKAPAPPIGVTLSSATTDAEASIAAFQRHHFPVWAPDYAEALQMNRHCDVVLARDGNGDILGTALLFAPAEYLWSEDIGIGVGGFGKVGVRADQRRRGLGLALAAKATALLKERGHRYAVVDWTGRPDWYGRLGYEVRQTYRMATHHRPHNQRL